jgi:hypothetical protein
VTVFESLPWITMILLVAAAIAAAIVGTVLRQPLFGLVGLLPVGIWALVLAFGEHPQPEVSALWSLLAIGFAVLGVVGGSPLTVLVLRRAAPDVAEPGVHGGILVNEKGEVPPKSATREVLRGGTTIGYLERVAIVGAAAVGRVEVIAVIVAIKGLGRFSELDSAAARERFIIGTLVSMIWAAICAALILLTPTPVFA